MTDSKQYEFLSSAWGVEANSKAREEISANVETVNRKSIEEYIRDSDIRKLGISSSLPKEIARIGDGQIPPGKYLAQVSKFADITQPTKFQEEGAQKWRLLALDMVDGEGQKFKGIEYEYVAAISSQSWPGTKLLLHSSNQHPLLIRNSHLLLTPNTVEVLGGEVWTLIQNWKASREVEANRLLWKKDGVKKKADGEGAPAWIEFDPKKAPRYKREDMDKERNQWRNPDFSTSKTKFSGGDEETKGSRFQVEEFREETTVVKSTVSANAFKQASFAGKGKGKDRGGEDGGGKGKRRGKRDDDGQEEKRAPTHSSMGLAAFIKPTKDGKMPDEAIDLLAKPAKSAKANDAWDEGGWDEGGWDESGWGASSQGWSGSSGGGGRGGKGGSRKGGGKSGGGGKGKGGGGRKGGGRGGGGSSWSGSGGNWW